MTKLAQSNPDALARNLLHAPKNLKDRRKRREIWDLFQQLGGDAVIRRAVAAILHARSLKELEAVLHAASVDGWYETGAAIAQRFHREVSRVAHAAPDAESIERLRVLVEAACSIKAPLRESDLRALLKHTSPKLRASLTVRPITKPSSDCERSLTRPVRSRHRCMKAISAFY